MAGATTPGSHKILRDAAGHLRKVIGYVLGRREGIVAKWFLPPPTDAQHADANGIPNPVDHVIAIYHIIASDAPERADRFLGWIAARCGGRFVRLPDGQRELFDLGQGRDLLDALGRELKKKRPNKKRIAEARRGLQNIIDLVDTEEGRND